MRSTRWGGPMAACLVLAVAGCGSSQGAAPPRATEPTPTTQPAPQLYEGDFTVLADNLHGPELCTSVATSLPPQCGGLPVTNWDWDAVTGEERVRGTIWGEFQVRGTYERGRFTLVGAPTAPDNAAQPDTPNPDFSPACDHPDVADPAAGNAVWETMTQSGAWPPNDPRVVTAWVTDPRGSAGGGQFVANLIVKPGTKDAIAAQVRRGYGGPLCVVERDLPTESELAAVQSEVTDPATRAALGGVTDAWPDGQRGVVVAHVWVVDQHALDYARERWGDRVELHGNLRPVG